jgi:5-methyltetrahydropteroyltriglutamate--homocysteine methyltransferase
MTRTTPPFRADHVGSILRTEPLKQARAKRAAGTISAEELAAVEDVEIRKIIAMQESVGLDAITDGEFRRSWWHYDFLGALDGVKLVDVNQGIQFTGVQTKAEAPHVMSKLGSKHHPHIEHFKFLKANTKKTPKMAIPSPSMLHYRGGRKLINMGIYPKMEDFYHDLGMAYREVVTGFADAGCRYLQLDDCSFAYLCDSNQRKMLEERGENWQTQGEIYADMINAAVATKPKDMVISIHVCRGNFRSTFIASGGYEPIAELLFNRVNADAYFLEWDNDRSGGFEPLRFLPKGKHVVVGLITSKTGELEKRDDVLRRIEEASKYVSLDQLCLSPQCGFASTEDGNTLSEQQQWDKLRFVVDMAKEIWG